MGNQIHIMGRNLVRVGHRVTAMGLADRRLPAFSVDAGIKVYRVPIKNLHWYVHKVPIGGDWFALAIRELEYSWAIYSRVRELHRREPFDLVEATETGALALAYLMRDIPLVIRAHGDEYTFHKYTPDLGLNPGLSLSRVLQRAAMRRARILTSPSRRHAAEITSELGHHPPVEVIPNCVDLAHTGEDRPGSLEKRVLFVGRLELSKGVLLLIKAARLVAQKHPDACFTLAGSPHPSLAKSDIERLIHEYGLESHVKILGHVPWEQLLALYRRTTICVLPSYYETFGVAALEPMALGIPVVVTDGGALPEIVEDNVTGLVVPVGNAEFLARAIIRLLEDANLRRRLSTVAIKQSRAKYSVELVLEQTLQLYKRLLK